MVKRCSIRACSGQEMIKNGARAVSCQERRRSRMCCTSEVEFGLRTVCTSGMDLPDSITLGTHTRAAAILVRLDKLTNHSRPLESSVEAKNPCIRTNYSSHIKVDRSFEFHQLGNMYVRWCHESPDESQNSHPKLGQRGSCLCAIF